MTSPLAESALNLALADVGKQEEPRGTNWGTYVQGLLANVGIKFPAAWCCAFVYSKFKDAAGLTHVANPLPCTGGVLALWNKSKANRQKEPHTGDVFIMDFGNGAGHTGFVEMVDAKYVYTVEGNSNDDGSREGYEVVRRKRLRSDARIKGYLRF